MRMHWVSILVFLFSVAQAQEWQSDLNRYFDSVRKGVYPSTPQSLLAGKGEPETLGFLSSVLRDTSYSVRAQALELIYFISSRSWTASIRHRGVQILIQSCIDGDIEIAGTALNLVIKFRKTDFSSAAKDNVRKLVQRATLQYNEVLKLAAFLELRDLTADIQKRSLSGNRASTRWTALLSLARMGDHHAVADVIGRVGKLPVTDELVYNVFPDLIFTRNRILINYMVEALMSESKDCLTADAEREIHIPCGYRIMEQLAPIVEGFPFSLDDSGDLQTIDYAAALQQVREWFINNTDYTILSDTY